MSLRDYLPRGSHWENRFRRTRRVGALVVFFAIWGAWILAAQASGQMLSDSPNLWAFLERNAWPIFTSAVAALGAYWKMSLRQDYLERDLKRLEQAKADAALVHEKIEGLRVSMEHMVAEVAGMRSDITGKMADGIAAALTRALEKNHG